MKYNKGVESLRCWHCLGLCSTMHLCRKRPSASTGLCWMDHKQLSVKKQGPLFPMSSIPQFQQVGPRPGFGTKSQIHASVSVEYTSRLSYKARGDHWTAGREFASLLLILASTSNSKRRYACAEPSDALSRIRGSTALSKASKGSPFKQPM
jgi:hypothetical protein